MIEPALLAAAVRAALPDAPLYALLDGARDRRVRGWVWDTHAPRMCLYRGRLPPELEDAAPWLLSLAPGESYTEQFFARPWRESWGVVLSCAWPAAQLRRHLRKFLMARTEDGKQMMFRYYDPRVLRLYLPTCTAGELETFFGPIQGFAAPETDEGGAALIFRREGEGLSQGLVP